MADSTHEEFEEAARHLARCEMAMETANRRNVATDPVEREEQKVKYERVRGELIAAEIRMKNARREAYGAETLSDV